MKYAYVGCRTTKERNARGEGLKVYEISEHTGEWNEIQCLKTEENPSFQCMDNEQKYLYSVHGDFTFVTSYRIKEDGTLEFINKVDIGGKNPVDVTVDAENKHVIVATLQGGTLYTIERNEDGVRLAKSYRSSLMREKKRERYQPFTSACGTRRKIISLPVRRDVSMDTDRCGR